MNSKNNSNNGPPKRTWYYIGALIVMGLGLILTFNKYIVEQSVTSAKNISKVETKVEKNCKEIDSLEKQVNYRFKSVNGRIDRQFEQVLSEIHKLSNRMDARFKRLNNRLDKQAE